MSRDFHHVECHLASRTCNVTIVDIVLVDNVFLHNFLYENNITN